MPKPKDCVDTFLGEFREQIIAGVRSSGAIASAWISLQHNSQEEAASITQAPTPQEQMRALFQTVDKGTSQTKADFYLLLSQREPELIAALEKRHQNSKVTQTEQSWTMESLVQSEDKGAHSDIITKREMIQRQRQLTKETMEEIEQLWKETQKEKNEIEDLKATVEQQEEDINRLRTEKYKQWLLMEELRLGTENVIVKLKKHKEKAYQERMQFQELWAEMSKERDILENRQNEVFNERHNLKVILYDRGKSQEKQNQERIVLLMSEIQSLLQENKKMTSEAKKAKDQMEKNMTDIKKELVKEKENISQQKVEIAQLKDILHTKVKKMEEKRWTDIKTDDQMHKARGEDGSGSLHEMQRTTERVHVGRTEAKKGEERRKEVTDNTSTNIRDSYEKVKIKINTLQGEMERFWDVLEEGEEGRLKEKKEGFKTETDQIENTKSDSENQREMKKELRADMQRQKVNMERKMAKAKSERDEFEQMKMKILTDREEIERERQLAKSEMEEMKSMKESIERQKQELDDKLRVTKKEIREMEVINAEIELRKRDLARRTRMNRRAKEELDKMKADIEHDKQEKINMQQQSEELQRIMEETRTEIQNISKMKMDTEKACAEVNQTHKAMQHAKRKIEEDKKQVKQHMDQLKARIQRWTLAGTTIKNTISEVEMTKEAISVQETIMDNEALKISLREMEKLENEIFRLKDAEDNMKEQIHKSIHNMKEINQEIKTIVMEINHLQSQRQESNNEPGYPAGGNIHPEQREMMRENLIVRDEEKIFKYEQQKEREENASRGKQTETCSMGLDGLDVKNKKQQPAGKELRSDVPKTTKANEQTGEKKMTSSEETNPIYVQTANSEIIEKSDSKRYTKMNRQELRKPRQALHMNIKESDGNSDQEETRTADMQKLSEGIYRSHGLVRSIKSEIENRAQESNDHNFGGSTDIQGLIEEVEQIHEILKWIKAEMRPSEIHLNEERNNLKWMKTAAKKQRRDLDQRLERTLRQRDELEIFTIKLQRQKEEIEQALLNMGEVKSNIEKMASETKNKTKDTEIVIKQMKVKLRQLEDLNYKIEAKTQNVKNCQELISQERAKLEVLRNQIKQQHEKELSMENVVKRDIERNKTARERVGMEKEIVQLKLEKQKFADDVKLLRDHLDQKNCEIEKMNMAIGAQQKQLSETGEMQTKGDTRNSQETGSQIQREATKSLRVSTKAEIMKHSIQKEKENITLTGQQTIAEITELKSIKGKKQELDDQMEKMKRQMKEMEILKSELEMERRECKAVVRKSARKKEEMERMYDKLQRERQLLRRETNKRTVELDQRLERTRRERDEIEILKIKLQHQKVELVTEMELIQREKESLNEKNLIQKQTEEFKIPEKSEKETQTSKVEYWNENRVRGNEWQRRDSKSVMRSVQETQYWHRWMIDVDKDKAMMDVDIDWDGQTVDLSDLESTRQKTQTCLEIIKREMETLENAMVHLGKQSKGLDNMNTIKSQLEVVKVCMQKMITQAKGKLDKMNHMSENIRKQRKELDICFEKIKRGLTEKEVLNSELEVKRKEKARMIRREQQVKQMWTELEDEKEALKKQTQRHKKELDRRLERIIRERDELEIMKLKLQREKESNREEGTEEIKVSASGTVSYQIKKQLEKIRACMGKDELKTKEIQDLNGALENEKKDIMESQKIVVGARVEVEHMKTEDLVKVKQDQRSLDEKKSEELPVKEKEVDDEKEMLQLEQLKREDQRHRQKEDKKLKTEMKNATTQTQQKEHGGVMLMNKMKLMETLRTKLQQLNENSQADIKNKLDRLDQNKEDQIQLFTSLEHKLAELDKVKENVTSYAQNKKESIDSLLKEITSEKIKASVSSIISEKEQLQQLKMGIEREKEILLIGQQEVEQKLFQQNMTKDELMKKMKLMETLRTKLQQLNESNQFKHKESMYRIS
ncbi:uncharacterized protein LOC143009179 [Genypterus blacodes]|uniref:uncharacterized protein LOC143009179 n=1 Tax=Genypterus blacodes TaxID=154954 RepID=UPI003F757526